MSRLALFFSSFLLIIDGRVGEKGSSLEAARIPGGSGGWRAGVLVQVGSRDVVLPPHVWFQIDTAGHRDRPTDRGLG
jgi:hypothetical protein